MKLSSRSRLCNLFIINSLIFFVIFSFLSNIILYVNPTEGGNAQNAGYVINYRLSMLEPPEDNKQAELHNLVINKVELTNNIIPEININTNIATSMTELIRITKQLPLIKLSQYNSGKVSGTINTLDKTGYLIITGISFSASVALLILWELIVSRVVTKLQQNSLSGYKHQFSYRPDIDGLRAVAILMVILFHFNNKLLPGGFIGVDIFFVISGYLITRIIYSEMENKAFSFKKFYTRRIKRILPTLYIMLLTLLIIGAFILPNGGDTTELCNSVKANLFYYYNFYLLANGHSYFDNPENQQLLLHTWSLAVEEQFYIVFPIILLCCVRKIKPHTIIKVLVTVAILSLLVSIYYSHHDRLFAYYMLPSRAFELLLGSILAIGADKFIERRIGLLDMCYRKSSWFAILGLAMIFVSSLFINKASIFPGYRGLVPSVGATLFIFAGCCNPSNLVSKIMANRYMVFIGLISYALYIWHWPILALYHYENPASEISLNSALVLLAIIVSIAIINYFIIERPLKALSLNYVQVVFYLCIIPIGLILLATAVVTSGIISKSQQLRLETQLPDDFCYAKYTNNGCLFGDKGATAGQNVLLFGDSHAAAFGSFISELAIHNKFKLAVHTSRGCPPILDPTKLTDTKCREAAIGFASLAKDYKTIIIAGAYSGYMKNKDFLNEFSNTLNYLKVHGKKVILVGDVPYYPEGSISYILRRTIIKDSFKHGFDLSGVNLSQQNIAENKQIKKLADQENIHYFDFESEVSSTIETYPFYNRYLLYADSGHLNPHGAYLLAKHIEGTQVERKLVSWVLNF